MQIFYLENGGIMKKILLFAIAVLLGGSFVTQTFALDQAVLNQADQFRQEQSFQLAVSKYRQILKDDLSEEQSIEIKFKLADSLWRTGNQQYRQEGEKILKGLIEVKEQKRWQAEAYESLAGLYLQQDRWQHQQEIKDYLNKAKDYWAGASDVALARTRFVKIGFILGDYVSQTFGWYEQSLEGIYKKILKVAKSDQDKARAYYALAMGHSQQAHDKKKRKKAEEYFKKIIKEYSSSEWADDAYYYFGQMYENISEFGQAVKIYREFVSKFSRGTSQWVDNAKNQLKRITSPEFTIGLGYNFLPGTEVEFGLRWRNIGAVTLTLYKLDLVQALQLDDTKKVRDSSRGISGYSQMVQRLVQSSQYESLPVARSWTQELKNEQKYQWHGENKTLAQWMKKKGEEVDVKDSILSEGTYLLVAASGSKLVGELVLVSDIGVVSKTAGRSVLFYAFDGKTGKPKAEAQVKYHYSFYNNQGRTIWIEGLGVTDENGLLNVSLKSSNNQNYGNQHNVFAVVSDGVKQAFTNGNYYSYRGSQGQWQLYAFADRPAYRPNEEVSFKAILRKYDGIRFLTPEGMQVKARIYDARGNQVREKVYALNAYGSFSDSFMLDEKASLGEYRLELQMPDNRHHLGSTPLFRLEEYKLPEFLVNIKPEPKEDQKFSSYRLGDEISIALDAQYYFGGAVAQADVEYLVYQNNYYHTYYPSKKYPWFYSDLRQPNYYHGNGQLVHQGKIKTDEHGKAVFSFETPKDIQYDLTYRVEARVVDKSRREIKATAEIKVTQKSFYAYLTPKQNLYRPGDKAKVDIKVMTANEEPVVTDAKIDIIRNWWNAPIIIQEKVTRKGRYDENILFTKFVKTNERGEAVFEFQPEQDGYYTVKFTGYDTDGSEITALTHVYVCAKQSNDIGYKSGGVQIITEKDTYNIGETIRAMVVADKPDTWVLMSSEAEEIYDYQMLHLDGPVKLIEIPVTDAYTPNVFLYALSAQQYQLKTTQVPIIVPPQEKFLDIKIISDKEIYQPREEGMVEIEVTDKDGNPVVGEVSLGMVDSSVYYIQSEYAKDIREHFYGQKRQQSVQMQTSFYQRQYKQKKIKSEEVLGFREDFEDDRSVVVKTRAVGTMVAMDSLEESMDNMSQERLSAPSVFSKLKKNVRKEKKLDKDIAMPVESSLETPEVRTDFRSTVIWQPSIVTDEDGRATVKVKFPDSLTTWRTTARVITSGTKVGNITHEVKTKKEVIVRLQAPRFFTERDKVTISANVHNYGKEEKKIKVTIKAEGLEVMDEVSRWVTVAPQGEERVDWICLAKQKGTANITVMAQTEKSSDAMKKQYAVIPHGIEKFIAKAVVLKGSDGEEQSEEFTLNIPKERIKEATSLQFVLSPSIAATLLDALPYLAEYPYGCVEQTMSRFLPSVIVANTMKELGLSDTQIASYIGDVLSVRGDPQGHPKVKTQETFKKINKMTKDGLKRLYDFQHSDGGWGWWKEDDSDRFMTAYVVWGMGLAQEAGIKIKSGVLNRAVDFLNKSLVEEENNPDMLAWMLHAVSYTEGRSGLITKQRDRLWERREQLNPYTRALFALAEKNFGDQNRADILARNLANGILEDKGNGTVHWGKSGVHYRWSEGGVEATAFAIKALAAIDPQSEYLKPAVKWMALNRRGSRWKNTRDTAIAILGLSEYLKTVNELNPNYDYEIYLNGQSIRKGHVDAANVFAFDRNILLPNEVLKDGENKVKVVFQGEGVLYLSGYLKYFTLEEDITAAGNEVFVERKYFKEARKETLLKGYVQEWTELKNGDQLTSGDRVKVEVILEAKNHYEYLVAEDYKPAGLEAVALKSGTTYAKTLDENGQETGETVWAYQEFRDQKVAFFITKLPQGKHKLTYELRAEVPGTFHAMPNQTHAMYVPEIRANSEEMRFEVLDE
ncbi:hypothetical protein MNBD_UNCLBAC01-213 [hydrothermal vent metagenome]|uniref:Alpha-2-macroglobulin n=1 Tax=hydrothermal vent metagenome TaxID=652676 RepID=A0A3B1CYM7_9ZZZZ